MDHYNPIGQYCDGAKRNIEPEMSGADGGGGGANSMTPI